MSVSVTVSVTRLTSYPAATPPRSVNTDSSFIGKGPDIINPATSVGFVSMPGVFPYRSSTAVVNATGGTYLLVVEVPKEVALEVGALGEVQLPAGGYTYTGSAQGSGGFARVDRHRELATGARQARHWHIDYVLSHPTVSVADTVRFPGRDVECTVARRLGTGPVPGFGASDCDCRDHLARFESTAAAVAAARELEQNLSEPACERTRTGGGTEN